MANITFELKEKLLVFGVIEILSGAVILVLGVFLGSMQGIFDFFGYFSFFTFYSGYPVWGPLSFIFTGCSSIVSGRYLRRILEQARYLRYLVSAVMALLGVMVLSANLALNNVWLEDCPYSESPDLCLYMGTSNNGLMSLMLIFTSLELVITLSTTVICEAAHCIHWAGYFV
ncbi:membrane-spanning 4-domains subfamily A member 3-like isoform X2 [Manis pentadactyla]|uniref:membrane-spanning 4-domains subfamily A member 3-like isoform X2 n=1 Tax=Manis pentadactyla TaxID=143292 RepID=UPI00255D05DD|nr:membrane-spanning 4-domains subfamily A member 3-like isoform X2 [Manis pentadactyla]